MLYAFGGFLGGVVLMATLGFTYFFAQQKNDSRQVNQKFSVDVTEPSVDNEAPTREPEAIFEATKAIPSKSVQPSNVTEPPADFPQPKEDELSKAFLRPAETVSAPSMKSASSQPLPKENKKQNSSTQSSAAPKDKNHDKVAKAEQAVEKCRRISHRECTNQDYNSVPSKPQFQLLSDYDLCSFFAFSNLVTRARFSTVL